MNIQTYNKIKEKYGQYTSWAVWNFDESADYRYDLNGNGYMINSAVKALQNAKTDDDLSTLGIHTDAVIVALNYGERNPEDNSMFRGLNAIKEVEKFTVFHEELDDNKYKGDSRQKEAYQNSILWGAYMTDLIKFNTQGELTSIEDSNSISEEMNKYIKDTAFMQTQINGLIDELTLLGTENPVIFCVGDKVHAQLNKKERLNELRRQFGEQTKVIKLPHYSSASAIARNTSRYHEHVQKALNKAQQP